MTAIDHRNKTLVQEGEPFVVRNYRVRAYPSKQLRQHLAKVFCYSRFVYNQLLASSKQAYQDHLANPTLAPKPDVSPYGLSIQLTTLMNTEGNEWLYEVSKGPLQAASHNLGDSYKNFLSKRSKAPKFKKKHHEQSAYFPGGYFTIVDGLLTLAKTDQPLRLRGTRALPSYPLGVTVTKTPSGKYFVTFTVTDGSDTHESTDWQIATDASFSNVVADATNSSTDKISYTATDLTPSTTYYVRPCY